MSERRPLPVWDIPTRLTHWLFAVCIAVSWWTAEERLMDWHRYSGYTMLGLLVFRIYWGIAGSSTARFARFLSGPRAVLAHLRLTREQRVRIVGHTPIGSWSVVALLLAMVVQVTLGLFATDIDGLESGPWSHLVSFDGGRAFAEAHELSFDLTSPMLSGRKHVAEEAANESLGMQRAPVWRLWTGVALATLVVWIVVNE